MSHGERDDLIRDLGHDLGQLNYAEADLRKYLGPEMGALNVKQTEGLIVLIEMVRHVIMALGALNKELSHLSVSDRAFHLSFGESKLTLDKAGEIVLRAGDASVRLARDGSVDVKGMNIRVNASGAITIQGASDVTVTSAKELHLSGLRTQ